MVSYVSQPLNKVAQNIVDIISRAILQCACACTNTGLLLYVHTFLVSIAASTNCTRELHVNPQRKQKTPYFSWNRKKKVSYLWIFVPIQTYSTFEKLWTVLPDDWRCHTRHNICRRISVQLQRREEKKIHKWDRDYTQIKTKSMNETKKVHYKLPDF